MSHSLVRLPFVSGLFSSYFPSNMFCAAHIAIHWHHTLILAGLLSVFINLPHFRKDVSVFDFHFVNQLKTNFQLLGIDRNRNRMHSSAGYFKITTTETALFHFSGCVSKCLSGTVDGRRTTEFTCTFWNMLTTGLKNVISKYYVYIYAADVCLERVSPP